MAIQILVHEPSVGMVDQTGRLALGTSDEIQLYNLIRGQVGTGAIPFQVFPGDSYAPTQGSAVAIREVVSGVPHQAFFGKIMFVERKWNGNLGCRVDTINVSSAEAFLDDIRIPPTAYFQQFPGFILTDLWNKYGGGIPLALGTIENGPAVIDFPIGNWERLSDIAAQLATIAGFVWGVRMSSAQIYFQAKTTTPAPFTLTKWVFETGEFKIDQSDYRNRQLISIAFEAFQPSGFFIPGDNASQTIVLPFRVAKIVSAILTTSTRSTFSATLLHTPSPGDTFSITPPGSSSPDPYTWVATLDNTMRRQVLIGDTVEHSLQNAADAINQNPATQGVKYSWPTWENDVANAGAVSATSPASVPLTIKVPGSGGNDVTLASTGTAFAWSAASPSGGTDGTVSSLATGIFANSGILGADVQYNVGSFNLFLSATVLTGQNLYVSYYRLGANIIVVEDSAEVATRAAIEGSSGQYMQLVTDSQQYSAITGYKQALAYLTAYKQTPKWLQFVIDIPLLDVGMLLTLTIVAPSGASAVLDGDWLVYEIQATLLSGKEKLPEPDGHFRYTVTVISTRDVQSFIDYYLQATKVPPPAPPPALNPAAVSSSTPTLKSTTPSSPGTGAPTGGTPQMSGGQQFVQETLDLAVTKAGADLVASGTGATVTAASYAFVSGDVGKAVVIVASTGWTPGTYLILSISGTSAVLASAPATAGATGGKWGLADAKTLQFTWVPSQSAYTNNQIAIITKLVNSGGSPPAFTSKVLTPFRYNQPGYVITLPMTSEGPDYQIFQDTLILRDAPSSGDIIKAEYFPAGPGQPHLKAGDVSHTPVFLIAMDDGTSMGLIAMTSADGVTWTVQTVPLADTGWTCAVNDAGTKYVLGTEQNTTVPDQVASSTDATSWTARSTPADNHEILKIIWGGGKFVALTDLASATIMTSTDGETWTGHTVPTPGAGWVDIAYSPDLGLYVAVSNRSGSQPAKIMTSGDAVTWTDLITGTAVPTSMNDSTCIAWGAGIFVALGGVDGSGQHLVTSTDGVTWTQQSDPNTSQWLGVAFGGGKFVAVGHTSFGDQTMSSSDGLTWATHPAAANKVWVALAHSASLGLWVAVASASASTGNVMTSSDGDSWSSATTPSAAFLHGVCFG